MKSKNPIKKIKGEYRVLALAALFFATGLYFWFTQGSSSPAAKAPAASVAQMSVGNSGGGSPQAIPQFAGMPAPPRFRTFTFANGKINGATSFVVTSTCADAYVAMLVFPTMVDYREDIARAVYNTAFPCAATGTVITATITAADLGNAPSGTYYYFTAAQGTSGAWYNPK